MTNPHFTNESLSEGDMRNEDEEEVDMFAEDLPDGIYEVSMRNNNMLAERAHGENNPDEDVHDKSMNDGHVYSDEDENEDEEDMFLNRPISRPASGCGLWKKPIQFVPAGTAPPATEQTIPLLKSGQTWAEMYSAIVFPNGPPAPKPVPENASACNICGEYVQDNETDRRAHQLSLAHQLALPHIPIPSAIDRTRMGYRYLKKHGFDIDARRGLGAYGQGILYPLVPKEKRSNVGIGIVENEHTEQKSIAGAKAYKFKQTTLDAGKLRKLAKVQRKKDDKLQRQFYGNDDVEKYLVLLEGEGSDGS